MVGDMKDFWPIKTCSIDPQKFLFWNRWRRSLERDLADPGSPGKWP